MDRYTCQGKQKRTVRSARKMHSKPQAAVITVISVMFIVSFTARLSAELEVSSAIDAAHELFSNESGFSQSSDKLNGLIAEIEEKRAELSKWEKSLEEERLMLLEQREDLREKITDLSDSEDRLRALIGDAKESSTQDVQMLSNLYGRMKSKDAASMFNLMEPPLAAGFISNLPPDVAANILSELPPEKSYAISVFLAGRNSERN